MLLGLLTRTKGAFVRQQTSVQEKILLNQGRTLAHLKSGITSPDLTSYEFSIFSQFGEDGIIQYLVSKIPSIRKCFVEFGVETFAESNCRFLMMKDGWRGVVFDGSADNVARIQSSYWFWRSNLTAKAAFIDRDNVAALFEETAIPPDCGILSIDIDGMDYFVLESLEAFRPAILICEYNGLFGPTAAVTVPYDPQFVRHDAHYSGLYFGASLAAFASLADERGYALMGVTSEGLNAFFVRRDLLWPGSVEYTAAELWRPLGFRQSRDKAGQLTCAGMIEERATIAELPLLDLESGRTIRVKDLPPLEQPVG